LNGDGDGDGDGDGVREGRKKKGREGGRGCHGPDQVWEEIDANDWSV